MSTPHAVAASPNPWAKWGWLMGAVWLVFLIYPGMALSQSTSPDWLVVVGWVGLFSFAAAYIAGFVIGMRGGWQSPTRLVIALFFAAIGCAMLTVPAIGWGATSFLPFLMAYAAYGIGVVWHWATTFTSVALVAGNTVAALSQGTQPPWVLVGIIAMMAVVNTINVWLIGRSVADDEVRMELATSEERETIARDVHDLLGHSLTVVKLKAELASRLIDRDPQAARAELEEITRITGEAISSVRSTVTGLRTHSFDDQLRLSSHALTAAGVTVNVMGIPTALSPAQSIPAAWILREATTNILRHANASRVTITVAPGELTVIDNGAGVASPDEYVPEDRIHDGNGVRGMRERASAAGAILSIESARPGRTASQGTRVSVVW